MRLLLSIFTFSGLLLINSGCASTVKKPHVPVNQPTVVAVPLTEELLYDAMVAALAMDHKQFALAEQHYAKFIQATQDSAYAIDAIQHFAFVGEYGRGVSLAKIMMSFADDPQQVHRWIAVLALKDRDDKTVLEQVEWALSLLPSGQRDIVADDLFKLFSVNTDIEFVKPLLRSLQGQHSRDVDILRLVAIILFKYHADDEAYEALGQAFSLAPNAQENILVKTRFFIFRHQNSEAIDYLASVLSSHQQSVAIRSEYAKLLLQAQRYDEAKEQFFQLSKMGSPKEKLDALYTLSLLTMDLKQRDEARVYFKQLIDQGGYVAESHYYLGVADMMDEQKESAISHFRKVDNKTTYWLDAQSQIGRLLVDTEGAEQALEYLDGLSLKNAIEVITIAKLKARFLQDLGRKKDAIEIFDQALERYPEDVGILYGKALVLSEGEENDVKEAEKLYLRILKQQPDYAHALNALGYTLADRTDRYEEALGYIQRALELLPQSFAVMDSMGWVQYRLGHYDQAINYLEQAFDGKVDPDIAAHLGEVYWKKGDMDQAREIWGRALLKFPKNKVLLNAIEKYDVQ